MASAKRHRSFASKGRRYETPVRNPRNGSRQKRPRYALFLEGKHAALLRRRARLRLCHRLHLHAWLTGSGCPGTPICFDLPNTRLLDGPVNRDRCQANGTRGLRTSAFRRVPFLHTLRVRWLERIYGQDSTPQSPVGSTSDIEAHRPVRRRNPVENCIAATVNSSLRLIARSRTIP